MTLQGLSIEFLADALVKFWNHKVVANVLGRLALGSPMHQTGLPIHAAIYDLSELQVQWLIKMVGQPKMR